jgi:hypothetical protein
METTTLIESAKHFINATIGREVQHSARRFDRRLGVLQSPFNNVSASRLVVNVWMFDLSATVITTLLIPRSHLYHWI